MNSSVEMIGVISAAPGTHFSCFNSFAICWSICSGGVNVPSSTCVAAVFVAEYPNCSTNSSVVGGVPYTCRKCQFICCNVAFVTSHSHLTLFVSSVGLRGSIGTSSSATLAPVFVGVAAFMAQCMRRCASSFWSAFKYDALVVFLPFFAV